LVAQRAHFEAEGSGAGDAGLVLGRVGAAYGGAAQMVAVVEAQAEGQAGVEGDQGNLSTAPITARAGGTAEAHLVTTCPLRAQQAEQPAGRLGRQLSSPWR